MVILHVILGLQGLPTLMWAQADPYLIVASPPTMLTTSPAELAVGSPMMSKGSDRLIYGTE